MKEEILAGEHMAGRKPEGRKVSSLRTVSDSGVEKGKLWSFLLQEVYLV